MRGQRRKSRKIGFLVAAALALAACRTGPYTLPVEDAAEVDQARADAATGPVDAFGDAMGRWCRACAPRANCDHCVDMDGEEHCALTAAVAADWCVLHAMCTAADRRVVWPTEGAPVCDGP